MLKRCYFISGDKVVYLDPFFSFLVRLFCMILSCTAITNYCVCALYLNLACWEIACSSACACESLIICVNDSGYESIMSHME